MSRLLRGKEGKQFCIALHLAPHFKLGRALQSWEKVTCVAPSPFGEEHWKTKSIKSPFVLDYCFTLRSRSFHLLTQINIHFASRYFGVPSLRSVSLRKIRFVQFRLVNFRPFKVGKGWIALGFRPRNDGKYFRAKRTKKYILTLMHAK